MGCCDRWGRLAKAPPRLQRCSSAPPTQCASGLTYSRSSWPVRSQETGGEMREPNMLDPTPELPDDTPMSDVEFPARIRNVLVAAGLQTVGEVRETSDEALLSFPDFGKGSVAHLRETLGLPSTDGVRPVGLWIRVKK